jgi:hypothetical protein
MADYGSSATFNRALTLLRRKHPQAQTAIDRLVPALEEMYRLRRGPKPRSPNWFERYNPQAGVPRTATPAWRRALALAERIYANVLWLIDQPPIDLDIKPALIELGSIPYDTVLDDDDDLPDDYGVRVPAGELPQLIGTGAYGWSPEETGDLIVDALSSESRGGHLSDDQIKQTIAEKIWSTEGHLELVPIDKIVACDFIAKHHSALPTCNPRGMLYAIGARYRGQLVAVATAGTPTGRWGPGADCPVDGILELTRIASIGGLTRTDRRGRTVPPQRQLRSRCPRHRPPTRERPRRHRLPLHHLQPYQRARHHLPQPDLQGPAPRSTQGRAPPLRRSELPRRAPRPRQDSLGGRPRRAPPRLDPDPRTTPPRRHPSLRRRP